MSRLITLALLGSLAAAPAFGQTKDHAPSALGSSAHLRHDKGESWTYLKPHLDLSRYQSVLVEPTVLYSGPDAQFNDIKLADRQKYVAILTDALRSELARSIRTAARAGPDALRVRVTLLGAEKTIGGVATVSHVMPIGLLTNAVKSAVGKKGSMTGSVLLAVEITDSTTGELLAAAVRREAPDALDIPATVSTSDTVEAAANGFAKHLREKLEKAMAGTHAGTP